MHEEKEHRAATNVYVLSVFMGYVDRMLYLINPIHSNVRTQLTKAEH